MERLKEGMLQLTKGWDRAQVERLVQDVMLDVIDPFVYQEALDLIAEHQAAGRRIYIVSSSPEEVVRPLARHFGVSGVIATRAAVGPDNRYTGELEFYAYGEQKAEAIRELAARARRRPRRLATRTPTRSPTCRCSRSSGTRSRSTPTGVCGMSPKIAAWEIRDFRNPVRLRSRIADAVPPKRAGVAAAVVGAVGRRGRARVGVAAIARAARGRVIVTSAG